MQSLIRATLIPLERASERLTVGRPSTLRSRNGEPIDILIEDLSSSGCKISTSAIIANGETIVIGLPGVGTRRGRVVWSGDSQIGCAFDQPLSRVDIEETLIAQTLSHVNFPRLDRIADAPPTMVADSPPPHWRRVPIIIAAAIGGWTLIGAIGVLTYRALLS